MFYEKNPIDRFSLNELLSIVLVLVTIKDSAKNLSTGRNKVDIVISKKMSRQIENEFLPNDMHVLDKIEYADLLKYLKSQQAILELAPVHTNIIYDYRITLIPDNFNNFYDKVMVYATPYLQAVGRDVNFADSKKSNTADLISINKFPLSEVKFNLGDGFAVHENNVISYKGSEIPLEPQLAKLVALILERSQTNSYTSVQLLSEKVLSNAHEYNAPEKYIVKMVSEARKQFKSVTNTDIDFFPNKSGFGYIFKY